jgi:hypothetical protein
MEDTLLKILIVSMYNLFLFYRNLVLIPCNETLSLPCLILAEFINKAGLICSVYEASLEQLKDIAAEENTNIIVCGGQNIASSLRHFASNLKLGIIIMSHLI